MRIVILGLSITSSWGNGHATTYRGLVRELTARGHDVLFLERDQPWYAENRDLPKPPFGETHLYKSVAELKRRFGKDVREADCVIVGSYVTDGIAVGEWITLHAEGVTAFYDIDTPVTLGQLTRGECEYLSRDLIARYSLYLSFTGGPTLRGSSANTARLPRARSTAPSTRSSTSRNACRRNGRSATSERTATIGSPRSIGCYTNRPRNCRANGSWSQARSIPILSVAEERRTHHAPGAEEAPRILQLATVHPQRHPCRYDSGRLLAERAPLRSGCLRNADHQRRLGGPR
jgi:hypothetical protein